MPPIPLISLHVIAKRKEHCWQQTIEIHVSRMITSSIYLLSLASHAVVASALVSRGTVQRLCFTLTLFCLEDIPQHPLFSTRLFIRQESEIESTTATTPATTNTTPSHPSRLFRRSRTAVGYIMACGLLKE
jgi:hypothetical protein